MRAWRKKRDWNSYLLRKKWQYLVEHLKRQKKEIKGGVKRKARSTGLGEYDNEENK